MQSKLVDLGFVVARMESTNEHHADLTLFHPSTEYEDGRETPPKSVIIYGRRRIWRLKKLLDELFKKSTPEQIKALEKPDSQEVPF